MKKRTLTVLALLLALSVALFGFSACQKKTADTTDAENVSKTDKTTDETQEQAPDDTGLAGNYYLDIYYNEEPFASYQYPELRALQDKTGEKMGSMTLNEDGTGKAAYPGGSVDLTWDENDLYIDGKALDAWHAEHIVSFNLPSGEELTYNKLSEEEDFRFQIENDPNTALADPADYTIGLPTVERFFDGNDTCMVVFPVTNNSNKTLFLKNLYYAVVSPSGAETDYRSAHADITPVLLPGETGFFFEHTSDEIPGDADLQQDMVFICEWTADYARFEVKDTAPHTEESTQCIVHRPTGTVTIPAGTDPDTVMISVVCYGANGRVLGYGVSINISRDDNPYNYLEIPEEGGDAPFLVNMDGVFADKAFDQSLIDHYEFTAYAPRYFGD